MGSTGSSSSLTQDVYATGSVDGDDPIGSLAGIVREDTVVERGYGIGRVNEAGTASDPGGLVGEVDGGTVIDSYWDMDTTSQNTSAAGTGLETHEMQGETALANMPGFPFAQEDGTGATWAATIDPDDYPVLLFERAWFHMAIDAPHSVSTGDHLEVEYTVTNIGGERDTQDIAFTVEDADSSVVHTDTHASVMLAGDGDATDTFVFTTTVDDYPEVTAIVASDDDETDTVVAVEKNDLISIDAGGDVTISNISIADDE